MAVQTIQQGQQMQQDYFQRHAADACPSCGHPAWQHRAVNIGTICFAGCDCENFPMDLGKWSIDVLVYGNERAPRRCWCGGEDGEHEAEAHAEEGRW